jgi:hypothetical protein
VPQLLLLDTLGTCVEVSHQVFDLVELLLCVGVNNLGQVAHEAEVRAHRVGQTGKLTELGNEGYLKASATVFVDEQRLIGISNAFVVARLVVVHVAGHGALLVELGQRRLAKVNTVDLVSLLVVASNHSRASQHAVHILDRVLLLSISTLT